MSPPIPRILTLPQAALDAFMARSHMLGQLACRILGVAIGLVGLKNAKPMSIVPRSAPEPLGDRCEACSNRVGGHGFRARSSAERCCASYFPDRLEDHNNAKLASNAPRPAPVPLAEGCDGWVRGQTGGMGSLCGAARSAAAFLCLKRLTWRKNAQIDVNVAEMMGSTVGTGQGVARSAATAACLTAGSSMAKISTNPRQMRRGSRLQFSLSASTIWEGERTARSAVATALILYSILCYSLLFVVLMLWHNFRKFIPTLKQQPTETAIQPPFSSHFSAQGAPSPATLGDEYIPFPSLSKFTFDCATLFEPPASLATPSILVSTYFIISQPLGTEITFVSSRHRISRASFLRAHGSRTH
ncbi:hypothetical protein EV121DRAFT_274855 [Schizophyllum commune]